MILLQVLLALLYSSSHGYKVVSVGIGPFDVVQTPRPSRRSLKMATVAPPPVKPPVVPKETGGGDDDDGDDDEKYEKFWNDREKDRKKNYDKYAYLEYYGFMEKGNENVTSMSELLAKYGDDDLNEYNGPELSRRSVLGLTGLYMVAFPSVSAFKRREVLSRILTPAHIARPFGSRIITKPLTLEQLSSSVKTAVSAGLESLPSIPSLLPSANGPFNLVAGDPNAFSLALQQGQVLLVHYSRPSSIVGTKTLMLIESLRRQIPEHLQIISVMGPKFPHEAKNPLDALRWSVAAPGETSSTEVSSLFSHTFLLDKTLYLTREFAVDNWPTVLLCTPDSSGNMRLLFMLEEDRCFSPTLVNSVGAAVAVLRGANSLLQWVSNPILSTTNTNVQSLRYPRGVAVDSFARVLYVADTANHRILQVSLKPDSMGQVLKVLGSTNGQPGFADGSVSEALYHSPHGLAVDSASQALWVADTGNDAVRRVSIAPNSNGYCVTLQPSDPRGDVAASELEIELEPSAVLGKPIEELRTWAADDVIRELKILGLDRNREAGGIIGRCHGMYAPTDISIVDSFPYIAAAGSHQVWVAEGAAVTRPAFGSGKRGQRVLDGLDVALSDDVRFGEPTAITGGAGNVYVVDAEASSVRFSDLTQGQVYVNLCYDREFEDNMNVFGDSDGVGWNARYQNPRGLVYLRKRFLLMSDTYNHKLRLLYTAQGMPRDDDDAISWTIAGGQQGFADGYGKDAKFSYPEGLAFDKMTDTVFVADSGNHAIRMLDLQRNTTSTLVLKWA